MNIAVIRAIYSVVPPILGDQHPRQGDMFKLTQVTGVVINGQPPLLCPIHGLGHPALLHPHTCFQRRYGTYIRHRASVIHKFCIVEQVESALPVSLSLLDAAEAGDRIRSVIEILVLQALSREAQDNIPSALVPLQQALALAEPEGYVRLFVDEGQPMAALLREAAKHSRTPNYVSQLRSAFGKAEGKKPSAQKLTEPLSERELEVLRLLKTELNGPEIARSLMVSLNTMRTHTKNIYNKLGANNRWAALRRAEELNLL